MAKPYYVKFEIPENLVSPIYESLRVAVQTGKVKRGTNEATKAIERGVSKLIIIAEDVDGIISKLLTEFPSADTTDGIKIVFDKKNWVMVRPSGTEPIIRIYAESDSEKNLEILMKEYIQKINSFLDR